MTDLLKIAAAEIGQTEIAGPSNNPRIVEYAQASGVAWIDDDETPWCSTFMNWVAFMGEVERTDRANARSWLTVGRSADPPEPGDVVVFWRESVESRKGHVGLFLGFSADGDRVYVLGGNQGNQVGVTAYTTDRILAFRRLRSSARGIPEPVLDRSSTGPEVVLLQDTLKLIGFRPGTSDGLFGPKTEAAVKALQATGDDVAISGVYDEDTRAVLETAIQDLG